MKILIIGGAGYIGSHVAHAFMDNGDQIAVLDDFSTGSRINTPEHIEIYEGNILDNDCLRSIFSRGWDGIVHLAAFKAAGESMENPGKYSVNNISGTINILNTMHETGIQALVFSSSAAIFGEPEYLPIDENHSRTPKNFYGFTKLEIENLMDWYEELWGMKFASLRYFNAAGYDIQSRVPEPEHDPQNLIPILMETAVGRRDCLRINGDDYDTPDGTCIRDYVHVSDLADAHVSSMKYITGTQKSIKINLGSESGISVAQVVREGIRITGVDIPYEVGPRRKGDPAKLIASSRRAGEVLKWTANRSDAETLLSSTWEVYREFYNRPGRILAT